LNGHDATNDGKDEVSCGCRGNGEAEKALNSVDDCGLLNLNIELDYMVSKLMEGNNFAISYLK
jgi:hypothetical protein